MSELSLGELGISAQSASTLPSEHVDQLAATLDADAPTTPTLPLLWHWAFFNPVVNTADLGTDGHPRRESPLLARFPRRMWVGGEVRRAEPLRTDTRTVRRTRLVKHEEKRGSTGELLIVKLEHLVEQQGRTVLIETQDVIFREAGGVTRPEGPATEAAPPTAGWRDTFHPTPVDLFRFSAATFNSHRIHYDQDYATGVEHYPDLVVHGPLTAMLLAGSASRHLGTALESFRYRASHPLFVNRPILVDGKELPSPDARTAELTATRMDGAVAMTATATAARDS